MKLKAPPGAGDPCIAGVTIVPRDGFYDVDVAIGALLIECFGFAEVVARTMQKVTTAVSAPRPIAPALKPKLRHPAWRSGSLANKP